MRYLCLNLNGYNFRTDHYGFIILLVRIIASVNIHLRTVHNAVKIIYPNEIEQRRIDSSKSVDESNDRGDIV